MNTPLSKSIIKNTLYNLIGYIIPLLLAIIIIPHLLNKLGDERFGILSIAWMIIGYFTFFDFGISRTLTKLISEKIGQNLSDEIPGIFWTSMFLMLIISLAITLLLLLFLPLIVGAFKISSSLKDESEQIFYILIYAIPIVVTSAGLRGVLEAYQKFDVVNIMKVIIGIATYLGPILILIFYNSLFLVVLFLLTLRIIIWFIFAILIFKTILNLRISIKININYLRPIFTFSIWITVANLIVPIIFYSDRFLIGTVLSAAILTYYVTPFEIISKLSIIPSALASVLFPVFSMHSLNDQAIGKSMYLKGIKSNFILVYPIVLIIITFAYDAILFWLDSDFAMKSSFVLQILSIGILMNSLSLIPNIFFQGNGKPKIPTIINLCEFPIYIFLMWMSIKEFGINGAAIVFTSMAAIDAVVMNYSANKIYRLDLFNRRLLKATFSLIFMLLFPIWLDNIFYKMIYLIFSIAFFLYVTLKIILNKSEKEFIVNIFKLKFIKV